MNRLQLFNLYRAAGNGPCEAYRLATRTAQADKADTIVLRACIAALAALLLLGVL